ncbi:hypothetical protein Aduo_009527 [Ancylostoma duodenale]
MRRSRRLRLSGRSCGLRALRVGVSPNEIHIAMQSFAIDSLIGDKNSSSSTHQAHVSSSSDEDCSHRELRLPPSSSRHHPYANPGKFGISSSIYPDEHSWHPRASLTEATVRFQML